MRRLVPLLALALVAGCSSREHANPFDPQNPVTNGRPPGFVALAGSRFVELRWTRPVLSGDFAYRLFRRVTGEADFHQIGSDLGSDITSYFDFGLENGVLDEYRLYYVFSGATGGLPAEDHATPGPLRPWCADYARRTLVAVTPDGHHMVSETGGFFGPTYVAADPTTGSVWISDTFDGEVVIFYPSTGARTSIRGPAQPVAIAIDPIDRSAWICDQGRNLVFHYTSSGVAARPPQLTGMLTPIGIACDPVRDAIWVCERGGNQVGRYSRDGTLLGVTTLSAPSRVAVDSLTGDAWVTSFEGGRLVRFAAAGTAQDTIPMSGPIGVAVDHRRGRIWVAEARTGQVAAVRAGGAIEFRVGGLVETREVAVDLATGEAWVTAPGIQALVRISASGAVVERLPGFTDPYGIALDPGVSRGP